MKMYFIILMGFFLLVPKCFSQGTIAYCFNDPDRSPYYFVYGIKPDGSENKLILTTNIGLNHYEWSPDGKKIVSVGYQNIETSWSIYLFDADGTGLTRLTTAPGVLDGAPSWSPDGVKIAFTRSYPFEPGRTDEVWIMNNDGSNQRFSGINGFQPMWSPDGSKFVYCSGKAGNWEIYKSGIDGSGEQRLTTNPATDLNPVWSPDGNQIAFMSERMGNPEIFIMQADGTRPIRLTMNPGYEGMPRWSPDGSQLAFNSEGSVGQPIEVYLINIDGSDLKRLTTSPGNARSINPAWCPVQPSGTTDQPGPLPSDNQLSQNFPNPFSVSTTIQYSVSRAGHIRLNIMDPSGKRIATLVDELQTPGLYSEIWDATTSTGETADEGIYLYILLGEGFVIKGTKFIWGIMLIH
ncbi:MAG: hypothetical protein NTV01_04715 [Bacteroidia bacterium]|nr:hypothetical protein [Bacteroidia bacterium]